MSLLRFPLPIAAAMAFAALPLAADPALSVHARLFALDVAAREAVSPERDMSTRSGDDAVQLLRAPAALQWAGARLELRGDTCDWVPADVLPDGVTLIADSIMPVGPTGHAQLRCIAAAQYMERLPEGTFALRQVEADSPDVPRYVLTFQVEPKEGDEVAVSCRTEFAVARRRAVVEGVQIPIGKPLVDVFSGELSFASVRDQWQALFFRPPAPFASGALALIRIGDAPATPPAPAVESNPPRKHAREIGMVIDATCTDAGSSLALPSATAPVGYLLYDGGFGEYGGAVVRAKIRADAAIRAAWQDALAHAGYLPATGALAPRIVLTYHWGLITEANDVPLPSDRAFVREWGGSEITATLRRRAFVAISAYDYADFRAGRQTLLWRMRAETANLKELGEVFPALITASTSWIGKDQRQRSSATIQLADQRVVTRAPADNDPTAARTVDERRVRAMLEAEQRTITVRHDFSVASEEREPRRPLPGGA